MIKVFGHISPDTDTVCSAIVWAWYLNTHTSMDATPYVLGELNSETSFVLDYWSVETPELLEKVSENDEIAVVDTSNPSELLEDINKTKIIAIIDHHRLAGGLKTKTPVDITVRPLASTASVIYELIEEYVDDMPHDMAGLILSAILSDTLEFRSPTTTPRDKDIAEKLSEKLDIDIKKYAEKMLEAKSDLSSFTDIGLVKLDSKKYDIGDKNIRISVVETTDPEKVLNRKEGIISAIKEIVSEENETDDVLFFVIDILKEEATVFVYNDFIRELVSTSFGVIVEGDTEVLPGVISRKKQIIPVLKI